MTSPIRITLLAAALVAGLSTAAAAQQPALAGRFPGWDRVEDRWDRREDRRDRREDRFDRWEDRRDRSG